jgi:acetate kinase
MLGISGITDDVQELSTSDDPKAIEAIDLFCYRAACELSSLCATIEGCDAIVFTAGIGEKSPVIRKKICQRLAWLGVALDNEENLNNSTLISSEKSKIKIYVLPTNEAYIIAKHTYKLCH